MQSPPKGTDSHPLPHTRRANTAGGRPARLVAGPGLRSPATVPGLSPQQDSQTTPPSSVFTYTDAATGPASFWTVPTLPPDPGGACTPPGVDLGVWVSLARQDTPGCPSPTRLSLELSKMNE